ncbi:MAG TPA: cytochrome C oxidase subunit II [Candidatus Angelobacter sp.]|nr:cytochrome C oxidase subunit II [Candidatus Angelobacter sp.]
MRLALRLSLLAITFGCAWIFVQHPWWFPSGASSQAAALDRQFRTAFFLLGSLFLAGQLVLAFLLGRPREGRPSRGDWRLETVWTVGLAAIFFWFNLSGGRTWSSMTTPMPENPGAAVEVEITGAQFQWYFRYPGPDGVFGRVDAQRFARPEEGNPLGLDPADPAGQDDFLSPMLVLPAGRPANLTLRAQDVVHSVFIPAMRFKQDTVPGMDIHAHFTPIETGTYELACAELCGLGHYRMQAKVRVVSEEEFAKWVKTHEHAPSEK